MKKSFEATLDHLYEMLFFIRKQAIEAGFQDMELIKIELASEEALVNIISYGYPEETGLIEITCEKVKRGGLKITIRDLGVAYNPLNSPKKFDPKASLEARVIGGLGVYFILKIMDKVDYIREEGANVLTMWKHLAH